ncbi:hypothetical protein NDU88_005769 [Pleurodeles waltl]|uniref:Uncharacterized protein n=1 Tax=Pleurodeles waltl TaxID=8319 RepID=A0AAV7TY37_PLEWA|nr:hypothetical protein NDU88_005769 [Pleurodeles waltl]
MDQRVLRATELLKEAGRLDLLTAPAARRERPVRRAAGGVAAAVAACSPPRGSQKRPAPQVSRAGGRRGGRLASTSEGRVGQGVGGGPRPLGARRPHGDGVPSGSEDGDSGELLTGSEPWEEEEKAGYSAASWIGSHRSSETVRAKAWVRRRHTGSGPAPTSEMVQAETENGHMTDENGWEEKKTRQMLVGQ